MNHFNADLFLFMWVSGFFPVTLKRRNHCLWVLTFNGETNWGNQLLWAPSLSSQWDITGLLRDLCPILGVWQLWLWKESAEIKPLAKWLKSRWLNQCWSRCMSSAGVFLVWRKVLPSNRDPLHLARQDICLKTTPGSLHLLDSSVVRTSKSSENLVTKYS